MYVSGTIRVRTSYLGPTETNQSRMRAEATLDNGTRRQLTISFPYDVSSPDREVTERLSEQLGYGRGVVRYVAPRSYVILTDPYEAHPPVWPNYTDNPSA